MKNRINFLLVLVLMLSIKTISQTNTFIETNTSIPENDVVSVYVGAGFLEAFALGFDFPLQEFRIGGKANITISGGGEHGVPMLGLGVGIKSSYLFASNRAIINSINLEGSYLYRIFHEINPDYGISVEFTLGFRNETKGIHFFWNAGVGFTIALQIPSLYFPCVKAGLLWNV